MIPSSVDAVLILRCYVCVTRLVIEFLLVDQQNSAKLFAFDSVVRCFYDALLMVMIALLACHFFGYWVDPISKDRFLVLMENHGYRENY